MPNESKVAIVTGASSGMGEELSRDLVKSGWNVVMADIQPNSDLAQELGDAAVYINCNIADYDSQAAMFQEAWNRFGRIDALCANAGIVDKSSIYILNHRDSEEIPPAPNTICTDVDYKGVIYGTQLAIHFMRKNKIQGGKIVVTASVAGIDPHESYPEYDGAKAAVLNFVRAVHRVLKIKDNITINALLPGIVRTKIIPPGMVAAVSPECMTPVSTIVSAYHKFLDDDSSLNGEFCECSADKHFLLQKPQLANGRVSKRAVTVWDPLFKMLHHENSGLPDAIP